MSLRLSHRRTHPPEPVLRGPMAPPAGACPAEAGAPRRRTGTSVLRCVPKFVDAALRRQEVVEAVFRIIAADGLERASLREVADEAELAVGSVRHYFAQQRRAADPSLRRRGGPDRGRLDGRR